MNYLRNNLFGIISHLLVAWVMLSALFLLHPNSAYALPAGCVRTQEEIDEILLEGFDWEGADWSGDYRPEPGTQGYALFENYLCAGIEPSEISIGYDTNNRADQDYNFCLEEAQYYPSAQNTCFASCEIDGWNFNDAYWTTGEACADADPEDMYWSYVIVNPPIGEIARGDLGGCYYGDNARERCLAAQAPYVSAGLITSISDQCSETEVPNPAGSEGQISAYCFDFSPQEEPEDPFQVGGGVEACQIGQAFESINECANRMIATYPEAAGRIRRSPEDFCQAKTFETVVPDPTDASGMRLQEQELWCMDDEGMVGLSEGEIAENERVAAERQRLARIEAARVARAEERARIAAEVQKVDLRLQESGSLVPCTGGAKGSCGWKDLIIMANNIIGFVIKLGAVVMVLAILMTGFGLVTAQGNTTATSKARERLTRAVVGFVIVLCAWLIVDTVMDLLLDDSLRGDELIDVLGE